MIALVAGATRGVAAGSPSARGDRGDRLLHLPLRPCTALGDRPPETIEETAELVTAAGGPGIPCWSTTWIRRRCAPCWSDLAHIDCSSTTSGAPSTSSSFDAKVWEHALDTGFSCFPSR